MEPIQALQIVFEWLASLLPAPMMSLAVGLAPVVAAVVALVLLIPWVKERKRWLAPVLAVVIGVAFGLTAMRTTASTIYDAILMGVVTGLLAVGGVSWVKNVTQGTKVAPTAPAANRRTGTHL